MIVFLEPIALSLEYKTELISPTSTHPLIRCKTIIIWMFVGGIDSSTEILA